MKGGLKPLDWPHVSVVVINRNGRHSLEACLSSLQAQTYPDYEIILVDNASTDDSVSFIESRFPGVSIIKNETNLGFAGINRGILVAEGKYVAIINHDTRVDSNWLKALVEVAESSAEIGMCAPKILSLRDPSLIESVGLAIYPDGMARMRGWLEKDVGQYDEVQEILLPSGCAALYRKEMLDEVGLLDEDFFAYCEDVDLGLRGRLAGWKAVLAPSAVVYHHYSGYAGGYSPLKAFLVERNHLWVALKNFPVRILLLVPLYALWRHCLQLYAALAHRGSVGQFLKGASAVEGVLILVKAYLAAAWGIPRMLRKRRKIQAKKRVSEAEIAEWFKRYQLSAWQLVFTE